MKNLLLSAFFAFIITNLFSQGIPVSHTPEKKNAVLEEYTGIHCPYCPDGHKIAEQIHDAHPNDVVLIRVHSTNYAVPDEGEPDFRTSAGNYLEGQAGLTGAPAASINRHVFPGWSQTAGETAMGRNRWVAASDQILAENAFANIGAEAFIDVQTNLLTVNVQVYYTGAPSSSSNRIHVALIQDNLEGPQVGASTFNPGNILPNGKYLHQHVLREMITGISGSLISSIAMGTTIDKTFTYSIPDNYKSIPVVLGDLKIAVFLTETLQETITGVEVTPVFTNFPGANSSRVVSAAIVNETVCGFTTAPLITVQNFGSQLLTSLYFDYSINGSPVKTTYWTGSIESFENGEIALDDINFFPTTPNVLTVNTRLPNGVTDPDVTDDELVFNFDSAPDADNNVTMTLQLDYYGAEVTWEVVNSAGTELYSGGPYTNVPNPTTGPPLPAPITENFNLASGDCYQFVTHDSYGDGILGTGTGFTLKDSQNLTIISNYSKYIFGGSVSYGVDAPQPDSSDVFGATGIADAGFPGKISVSPNPTSGKINLSFSFAQTVTLSISLTNVLGQTVIALPQITGSNNNIQLYTDELAPGVYFLNVFSGDKKFTEKILIQD